MFKLVQLSDTHLSDYYGFFYENFCKVAECINASAPDLVINSGDLSLNGPERTEDLEFAKWCHEKFDAPVLFLPGNHDVGEEPGAEEIGQPMTEKHLSAYHALYGPSWWRKDIGEWQLFGINSQLLNTGLAEEREQEEWLKAELTSVKGPAGLFLHKPLFLSEQNEPPSPLETIAPTSLPTLNELVSETNVRFVASGHLHQFRSQVYSGISHHWCPSTAHVNSRPKTGADPALGFLQYTFENDSYSVEHVTVPETHPYTFQEILQNGRYKRLMDVPPMKVGWP